MTTLTITILKLVPVVGIVFILYKIWKIIERRQEYKRQMKDFPGPPPHWLWGNTKELTGDYEGMLRVADYAAQYHGAFPVWMGPTDVFLMAVHPTTVRSVLSGSDPKDEFSYALMRPWIGDGLLLSKGRKWDRNRRLMTPAFHQEIIKNYVKTFASSTEILLDKWRTVNEPVETFHHVSLLTLDSMMKCLFGHVSDCQNEKVRHPYIQGVYDVSELIVKRIINPLCHSAFIYYKTKNGKRFKEVCDIIHQHSQKLIRNRRQLFKTEERGARQPDFLDILLTAKDSEGNGLTDQEIRDEVDTFMFEGHDSTASSLSWCLYNLAKFSECQERCREEIKEHWGNKEDITWDDVKKLKYTHMCIKESMRLYPPVPNVSRCAENDISLPDGRVIPKGVRMAVSLFALHRNPEVWHEPEEFDPQRFSDENMTSSSSYMPFSIGPRNCIGQLFATTQIRVVIPMIIRKYNLTLDPSRPAQPESMLILRSKNGLYLNVKYIQ
ncbi:hypothetical protein FSP39_006985 [Pinctada imbricata]|uniref:Uncharacterized protein n=2 Tax=Pinctada TaxID=50425 RepID=A0AA88Y572_PINIB|nr:hypothetical protein FSP39_006985 [Pinctada imbricata]